MDKFILQAEDIMGFEKHAARNSGIECIICSYDSLDKEIILANNKPIPIGSVEFCKRYLGSINKNIPVSISYPPIIRNYLKRKVSVGIFKKIPLNYFVKPIGNKEFTGGIKKDIDHTIEPNDFVYYSEPIEIEQEFRFYIDSEAKFTGKPILGYSRYDSEESEDLIPNLGIVSDIIDSYKDAPRCYTIDMGYSKELGWFLVECNDAWAIVYYGLGNMTDEKYLYFITERWNQIVL